MAITKQVIWNIPLKSEEDYQQYIEMYIFLNSCLLLYSSKDCVLVMEVYCEWAGQCKAIQNFFRKLQFDHGEEKLKFGNVKAEIVSSLGDRIGKSRPCFDIYKVFFFF
jgi:hypothetical protein